MHCSVLAYGGCWKKSYSSFDGSYNGQVCMTTLDVAYYVVDAHMWGFCEACVEHHLLKWQGVAGRAGMLCAFGGLNHFLSVETSMKNCQNRILQAIELENGVGHQWHIWKRVSFITSERLAEEESGKYEIAIYAFQCSNLKCILPICIDWKSAYGAAKSWFYFRVYIELVHVQIGGMDQFKSYADVSEKNLGERIGVSQLIVELENWLFQVQNQQPRNLSALLQKLHYSDVVNEADIRGCKEKQRQIEMNLMLGDESHFPDLIWSWISPSENDQNALRPHADPQMTLFGAHLVLVLRSLLAEEMREAFKEQIMTLGDLILHMYTMFLFSNQHEELVGIYNSQLAHHCCIDFFVHMMGLRFNGRVHVSYKIFLLAIENLSFAAEDESKGGFEEINKRVLSRSREIKVGNYVKSSDVAEQNMLQSLQKKRVIQWLYFTTLTTINNAKTVNAKLLCRALMHIIVLFREFALISMWRVPTMPLGTHILLSLLAETLNQLTETLFYAEDQDVSENLKEFNDGRFTFRVLSLLEIYLHKNPFKSQVLKVFSNLDKAFINPYITEGSEQLGQRIREILQKKIFKANHHPRGKALQITMLVFLLEKNSELAAKIMVFDPGGMHFYEKSDGIGWYSL